MEEKDLLKLGADGETVNFIKVSVFFVDDTYEMWNKQAQGYGIS
jgi:hypothetical protein